MTTARREGERIVVSLRRHPDPDRYLIPLLQLKEAKAQRDAHLGQPRAVIQPYRDALEQAEAAVELLFQDELWIDEAERLYGHLGGSIIQAKAWRGDFNRGDEVEE